jgi:hypothetical protein
MHCNVSFTAVISNTGRAGTGPSLQMRTAPRILTKAVIEMLLCSDHFHR